MSDSTSPKPLTLGDWVRHAAHRMEAAGLHFGHGTARAVDEAAWMASHTLGLAPDFDACAFEEPLAGPRIDALQALLERRVTTRKPLAYLVGEAWFAGLRFALDEQVLVPRSPLAEIVVDGLMPWLDFSRNLRVLEVGTGSGCIAIALAHYWPALEVDAGDISEPALEFARANAAEHRVAERVRFCHSDVYAALDDQRYDLIISNPPYVPAASMAQLPPEYRHEPALALAAGDDGLEIFRRLLAGAPDHLTPGGFVLVEVGEAKPQAEALLGDSDALWLEFEHGGDGVVLLDRAAVIAFNEERK